MIKIKCNITAIILAAGKASRLKCLNLPYPKPLIPLENKPIVFWIANFLLNFVSEVLIVINPEVKNYVNFLGLKLDERITLLCCQPEGNGRDFFRAYSQINSPYLIVWNGDTIVDLDITKVFHHINFKKYKALLVLTNYFKAQNPNSFAVNNHNLIIRSYEDGKPKGKKLLNACWYGASTGILILNSALLENIRNMNSFEENIIPTLINNESLYAYNNQTKICLDIGVPERLNFFHQNKDLFLNIFKRNEIKSKLA